MEVQVSDFRRRLAHWLRKAEAGEAGVIRKGKRVVARLTPARGERAAAAERLRAARANAHIGDVLTPIDDDWEAGQ